MSITTPRESIVAALDSVAIVESFWAKVDRSGECWTWIGYVNRFGYGQFYFSGGFSCRAHRFAYELANGAIPDGLVLDHLCRVRNCVRPDHLKAVTDRENILAPGALSPTAINARRTHCVNGHEFTPENTIHGRLGRGCRACARAHDRAHKEKLAFEKAATYPIRYCVDCGHEMARRQRGQGGVISPRCADCKRTRALVVQREQSRRSRARRKIEVRR